MYRGERFNSISYLIGALSVLVGLSLLVVAAAGVGDALRVVVFTVYGSTLFLRHV